jgi:predicted MPP superfamily phosphohydrolase
VIEILLLLAAIGHAILWVALVNRAHALGIKRRWVSLLTLACIIMFAVMPVAVLAALLSVLVPRPTLVTTLLYGAACTYIVACAVVSIVAAIQRLHWRFHAERKGTLTSNHTTRVKVASQRTERLTSPGVATWLSRVPGNQILSVCVQEKQLTIPRLAPEFEGLRIAHLTDLHMSGRMTRPFYEFVVDETNRCQADMVAITGDIVDSDACLDWIPEVLGRLQAPSGVFYVLGNHDSRVNQNGLKAALARTNWKHVGKMPQQLTVRNISLILGGNERPWFGTPTDFESCPQHDADGMPLRIALSHSPDQIGWACTNDVDLMLAGHVHGGQICLPMLGAFTAPSMHGVRYAAGTFRVGKTVLHVSRGTASLTPIRWNCPPEIAVLNLRATGTS